ncbi:hypothetical protein L218DRAFT_987391 [Marasmius fiardii PR-910]|nr:hypothetical protein L218DRAFT_987391 [Marasmius fiardii PR-910]
MAISKYSHFFDSGSLNVQHTNAGWTCQRVLVDTDLPEKSVTLGLRSHNTNEVDVYHDSAYALLPGSTGVPVDGSVISKPRAFPLKRTESLEGTAVKRDLGLPRILDPAIGVSAGFGVKVKAAEGGFAQRDGVDEKEAKLPSIRASRARIGPHSFRKGGDFQVSRNKGIIKYQISSRAVRSRQGFSVSSAQEQLKVLMRSKLSSISMLPQELVDQIIDHLHNDISSLKSCTLVCRAWLPTSRLHLFSKIRLDIPRTLLDEHHHVSTKRNVESLVHKPCQRLHSLLKQNPGIIPHIHELTLVSGSPISSAIRDGHYHLLWTFAEETLPLLIRTLTHLRRFEITSPQGIAPWNVLPAPLSSAIKAVFSVPSLAYIRIKSWEFPNLTALSKLLRQCTRLSGLGLWSVRMGAAGGSAQTEINVAVSDSEQRSEYDSVQGHMSNLAGALAAEGSESQGGDGLLRARQNPSSSSSLSSPETPPALEFLTLDYVECPYLVHSLVSQLDLTHLRELRIAHSYDKSVQDILNAAGGFLERFHFKPGPIGYLSHLTSLCSIRLTLEEDSGVLPWISTLLRTLPTPSVLERIAIELYTDPKRLPLDDWRTLSKAIGPSSQFSDSLTHVHIGLFASPTSNESVKVHEAMTQAGVGVGDADEREEEFDEQNIEASENKEAPVGVTEKVYPKVMVYQLGTKKQVLLCVGLTPLIEEFEDDLAGKRVSGIDRQTGSLEIRFMRTLRLELYLAMRIL